MKKVNLKEIYVGLQAQMDAKLSLSRRTLTHPTSIGDVAELEWVELLSEYLPNRYSVDRGFVVDSDSFCSDQIDIVVYDKHFTPFVFHQNGVKYIPAEAVYAVIECKQDLSKKHISYASRKARSVRELKRTSVGIQSASGTHDPKPLHNILAGLFVVSGKVTQENLKYLQALPSAGCINFVCGLAGAYARVEGFQPFAPSKPPYDVKVGDQNELSLVVCVMNLISDLQAIGSVPAIDIQQYLKRIKGDA